MSYVMAGRRNIRNSTVAVRVCGPSTDTSTCSSSSFANKIALFNRPIIVARDAHSVRSTGRQQPNKMPPLPTDPPVHPVRAPRVLLDRTASRSRPSGFRIGLHAVAARVVRSRSVSVCPLARPAVRPPQRGSARSVADPRFGSVHR